MISIEPISANSETWDDVLEIFLDSSTQKTFADQKEKNDFIYKYLSFYKENHAEYFLVAKRLDEVIGYICGAKDSKSQTKLFELLPHYELFREEYIKYPAHLHINLSPKARGAGVGSRLINEFEKAVACSTHLITTPSARNRKFYTKNFYTTEIIRTFSGSELLFMGKAYKPNM